MPLAPARRRTVCRYGALQAVASSSPAIEQMIFKLIMFKSVDGELYLQPCRDHSFIDLDPDKPETMKDPFCRVAHTFRPRNHEHMI
jgi:hypothetical protein